MNLETQPIYYDPKKFESNPLHKKIEEFNNYVWAEDAMEQFDHLFKDPLFHHILEEFNWKLDFVADSTGEVTKVWIKDAEGSLIYYQDLEALGKLQKNLQNRKDIN